MAGGRMIRVAKAQPSKKVLSNKQLTKKIRSLAKQEGSRKHLEGALYSATTLTAGISDINYFDDSSLFSNTTNRIQHYYDCTIKLLTVAAAGATVRIIYGIDNDYNGTNVTEAFILDAGSAGDSIAPYESSTCASYKESKHKNRDVDYRIGVIKDMVIGLEQNIPKIFKVKLPMFNKRTHVNDFDFFPFVLALADENDVLMSMGVNYYFTDLEE